MTASKREQWDERYRSSELVWSAGPNQLFAELVDDLPVGRALDVACGEGRNAIWLAEQGWQVDAVDFSPVAIDKARQIAERRDVTVNWLVSDLLEEELNELLYDLVAIVFFHTDSAHRADWFPKLAGRVAPGGVLVYIGHDPDNIESGVGGPQDPDVLPSADELVSRLPGFEAIRAGVVERSVASDPGHGASGDGKALDTLVMVRKK